MNKYLLLILGALTMSFACNAYTLPLPGAVVDEDARGTPSPSPLEEAPSAASALPTDPAAAVGFDQIELARAADTASPEASEGPSPGSAMSPPVEGTPRDLPPAPEPLRRASIPGVVSFDPATTLGELRASYATLPAGASPQFCEWVAHFMRRSEKNWYADLFPQGLPPRQLDGLVPERRKWQAEYVITWNGFETLSYVLARAAIATLDAGGLAERLSTADREILEPAAKRALILHERRYDELAHVLSQITPAAGDAPYDSRPLVSIAHEDLERLQSRTRELFDAFQDFTASPRGGYMLEINFVPESVFHGPHFTVTPTPIEEPPKPSDCACLPWPW